MSVRDLSIQVKMFVTFAVIISLAVVIAGAGYLGMKTIMSRYEISSRVNTILSKMGEIRESEKQYLLRFQDKDAKKLLAGSDALGDMVARTAAAMSDAQARGQMEEIARGLEDYTASFRSLVAAENEKTQAMEEMKKSANSFLSMLNDLLSDQAGRLEGFFEADDLNSAGEKAGQWFLAFDYANQMVLHFTNARKFEKEFIISGGDAFLQKTHKSLQKVVSVANTMKDELAGAVDPESTAEALQASAAYAARLDGFAVQKHLQEELAKKMLAAAGSVSEKCNDAMTTQHHYMAQNMSRSIKILLGITCAVILLSILNGYFMARDVVDPAKEAAAMLHELEKGHLEQRVKVRSKDEIGDMAQTMNIFADSLRQEIVAALDQLAAGDFTYDVHPHDADDAIRNALKRTKENLTALVIEIQESMVQIDQGSDQVADSSNALSHGATENAASLEEITGSMTQITSQVKQNADNAMQAKKISTQAKETAVRGNVQMDEMIRAMGEIAAAGQDISKIIKVIDEIAFQTNLLALNAAVEAARAGQHGKGFAVVAEEVRNLAARSSKAAQETTELIESTMAKTERGTQIADMTAKELNEIVTGITRVNDLVGEIAAASSEQTGGIGEISQGLAQIDQVTQQNTGTSEETAAAAQELSSQVAHLRAMLDRFTVAKARKTPARLAATPESRTPPVARTRPPAKASAKSFAALNAPDTDELTIALDDSEFGKY